MHYEGQRHQNVYTNLPLPLISSTVMVMLGLRYMLMVFRPLSLSVLVSGMNAMRCNLQREWHLGRRLLDMDT